MLQAEPFLPLPVLVKMSVDELITGFVWVSGREQAGGGGEEEGGNLIK